jgi:signal transduction histidine kinase
MPAFTTEFVTLIALLLEAVIYLAVLVNAIQRRNGQEFEALLLGVYTLAALALQAVEAMWRIGSLPQMDARSFQGLQVFGTFFLAFLFISIVRAFVRREGWSWLLLGILWTLGLAVLSTNLAMFPEVIWTNGRLMLPREGLTLGWAIVGWLLFTFGAVGNVLGTLKQQRQPMHRNRLSYFLPVIFLLVVNDGLVLGGLTMTGNPLRLAAAVLMGYVVLTHNLPDARLILRRTLIYIVTTLLIIGFYMASTLGVQPLFRAIPNYNPVIVGAAIAILLALLFTPLLSLVQRLVDNLLHIDHADTGRTVHQYSETISNILDMQRLASVAVGLVIEAMQLQRGFLFLVDMETGEDGHRAYRLRAARTDGERQIKPISLDENNPIALHLARDMKPLLQYDLDLHSDYRGIAPLERQWFNLLEAEVYAPIFTNRRWIGLLALGAKLSGQRFSDEDLVTVSALANQTAVALENARLVENLLRLNTEVRQAYRDLDKANRGLERLDQTKSDFISIASHELRTPLTVIKGYTEMLLEDQQLGDNLRQVVEALHRSTLRLHEIMDSLFDIAQIDARSLPMHMQAVDTASLVRDVGNGLRDMVATRRLSLTLDLPSLPQVKADPNILRKVFSHLLNNAVKFTPDRGSILVNGKAVSPNGNELPNGGIEIVVADTGVGVDPEFRDLIFTKFYQPGDVGKHSSSKSRFQGGGAGLGLALSKGIVEAHGGRIWVDSPGHDEAKFPGSKFHVLLPLSKPEEGKNIPMGGPVNIKFGNGSGGK